MGRRLFFVLLLLSALLTVSRPVQPRPVAAQVTAPSATGLDIVRSAYDDLLSLFYRPIDPGVVLSAGWDALSADLRDFGGAPPSLGPLPEGSEPAFAAFSTAYEGVVSAPPPGLTPTAAAFQVVAGMTSSVRDDHTNFLSPDVYQSLLTSLGGGQEPIGVGIRTAPGNGRLVAAVAPGGPAANAGIRPGDVVLSVNGNDLTSSRAQTVEQALDGPAGTTSTITIERGGQEMPLVVTTGPFYFPALESHLLPGGAGYIRLDRFVSPGLVLPDESEILSDLDRRLDDLDAQGAQGLILDLRDNSGGDVFTAQELLGRFLPETVLATLNFDERDHRTYDLATGLMRPNQLPMVVLVNGRSASASEITASSLRDAGRALLVGEPTAGALASAQLVALPQGAGMEIAVAEAASGQTGARIDRVGVPVDIKVPDTRTATDYSTGADPQLAAAVAALTRAPQPPAYDSTPTDLSRSDMETLYGGLLPTAGQIPTNERLTGVMATNRLALTHPNEWIDANGGARDPLTLQAAVRARGYRGSLLQAYGPGPEQQPSAQVLVDVYSTPAGAARALEANDFPDTQAAIPSPVQLGDETVAYRGTWLNLGTASISWRRGDLVLTVAYSDVPGFERLDTLAALARLVDSAMQPPPTPDALVLLAR